MNLVRFGPISVRSGRFSLGRFCAISVVLFHLSWDRSFWPFFIDGSFCPNFSGESFWPDLFIMGKRVR